MIGRMKMRKNLKMKANSLQLIILKIINRHWSKRPALLFHKILCERIIGKQRNRCSDG